MQNGTKHTKLGKNKPNIQNHASIYQCKHNSVREELGWHEAQTKGMQCMDASDMVLRHKVP